MTAPLVEKDADAEAIFWEVRVSYEDSGGDPGTVLNHYVRIKIFNERGRESQSKVEIPAVKFRGRNVKIKDIAARTIKPDGSIVELKKEDVFERDVMKANGIKVKAMTFAMPGVEAGSVIEYRWREVREGISGYERFQFSRDIPVQQVKYWIKPYKHALVNDEGKAVGLRAQTFQTGSRGAFIKEKDGSYSMTLSKVAAFREEPRIPAAELSDIKVENVTDPVKPFTYQLHVRVPGYAQRTGKRLFVQPSFFQFGEGAMFPTAGRVNNVYFHYPWSEEDHVEITLPEGFALDNPEAPGSVFGYQSVVEQRTIISQDSFYFQDDLPALVSRYSITVPAGWRANGVTFNGAKSEPTVSGSTYTWELRGLSPVDDEPNSPSMSALVPRLAVSYFPPQGAPLRTFESWADVARFMSELEDAQADLNDAVAAKARELTANAKTELEKIQAIGRYVQNVHYISIQTNVAGGGGYRPHAATEVFAKAYGDCKDKANLMRSMLRAVKIDSCLVSIYSGEPAYVRAEWPSPQQFNHCIIAVRVSDETQAATVVKHPQLGRLLIFDATDPYTPVGDLPEHEQDSLALIDAKESTELLRMPVTPPDANRLERTTDVTLQQDGSITRARSCSAPSPYP